MIAFWISLPIALRYLLIVVIGLIGGGLANHIIYAFAYFNPRNISPWGPAPESAPARKATDRIPVLGWLGLRREAGIHGSGFWIRPILVEIATAAGLVMLYRYETQLGGLLPLNLTFPTNLITYEPMATQMFAAHLPLVVLMVAATVIDFDERIIPDVITIPGAILALCMGAFTIDIFLPTAMPIGGVWLNHRPTTFDAPWFLRPNVWLTTTKGLWTGLAIWSVWCFALLDRRWSGIVWRRRGLARAIKHFLDGVFHYGFWKVMAAIWVLGMIGISFVYNLGGTHWEGLFTSLVGLAVGGGVIWAIRIVAAVALNKEAMGFGDVTLMAMIGGFLGWQAALIAFFLSPFAAIVIVLVRFIMTRDPATPFGPYLCAGAMLTIVGWDGIFNGWMALNLMMIGGFLLTLCLVMLVLMAVLLFIMRLVKSMLGIE